MIIMHMIYSIQQTDFLSSKKPLIAGCLHIPNTFADIRERGSNLCSYIF